MQVELKLKFNYHEQKIGDTVRVNCNKNGVPLERFWRRRMNDNSVEVVQEKKVKLSSPAKTKFKANKEQTR